MRLPSNGIDTRSRARGLGVVVMAAGMGTRMRSSRAKVLHHVAGRPMVLYAVDLALQVAGNRIAVVVGHQAEDVRRVIEEGIAGKKGAESVAIVKQAEQLGTGHAVLQSRPVFTERKGAGPSDYVILNGDTPLLTERTVRELLRAHRSKGAAVTMLTAELHDPAGYGRVVRREPGGERQGKQASPDVLKIVEDRDATPAERSIKEINVGTYVVSGDFLFPALEKLEPHNAQGEYYLTDIVGMAVAEGRRVVAVMLQDSEEGMGVNTRRQLAVAERVVRQQLREEWLDAGVTMVDPASVWIDAGVSLGKDTVLHPNVTLEGKTEIGKDCVLRSYSRLTDCRVGDRVEVLDHCVLRESRIEDDVVVGPFAHLRPGVLVRRKAKVGNFVEMKKTELGEEAKASHLSYLGDAKIGRGVNIGAGTITCNYDGVHKYPTTIGDHVFVGSDSQLVAPVTVGAGAVIAAGTTVTRDVPADALAIARASQENRADWAAKRRLMLARVADDEQRAAARKQPAKTDVPSKKKRK
jgi:bifunctional UDP-N-acetylglucosamine pyrophosphorylase/glucosamine-1-phosphate N-acetyltransferase